MKKAFLITVLVILPLSTPFAWAEEDHPSDNDKKPAATMADKDKQMQMDKMQEKVLRMHEQMHKIMEAKNPQERERFQQEYSKMMQGMMGGSGMMGGDAKGGKMDGGMKGM